MQDLGEVKRWYDEGRTYQWMADKYLEKYNLQVSPQMFANIRARQGWPNRRNRHADLIPWRVRTDHLDAFPVVMLRAEARRRAGQPINEQHAAKLESWLLTLEEKKAVVHYDYDLGFFYIPRERGDKDIIRQPKKRRGGK